VSGRSRLALLTRRPGESRLRLPAHRLPAAVSLKEAQARVDAWISQYEEGYFHPLTNLARLAEEVGELAREINHRYGEKTKKPDEPEGDLGMEMADILFVIICLANREGVDLQEAFDRMMSKVESRDEQRWTKKRSG
jgi:NTP pyrophosphatase (non-canonical NTP hydrolase)